MPYVINRLVRTSIPAIAKGVKTLAGTRMKLSYKQLHIMKHALGLYMSREGVSERDYLSEKHLMANLNEEIEGMKLRHNIQSVKE